MSRAALLVLLSFAPALAAPALVTTALAQASGPPDRTEVFERSAAESYYTFDACGDGLAGRFYRRALAERFAACPFTPAARARHGQRLQTQRDKAKTAIEGMIEDQGGLPVHLNGMAETCHAHWADEGYERFRRRLQQYAAGTLPVTEIVDAPCDAVEITPQASATE